MINVRNFPSFVQADGYNPLTVASTNFRVYKKKMDEVLDGLKIVDEHNLGMRDNANTPHQVYCPGGLFQDLKAGGIELVDKETALSVIVTGSEQVLPHSTHRMAWTDH